MLFKSGLLETRPRQAGFVQLPGQAEAEAGGAGAGLSLFRTRRLLLFWPQSPERRACTGQSADPLPPARPCTAPAGCARARGGAPSPGNSATGPSLEQERLLQRSPQPAVRGLPPSPW